MDGLQMSYVVLKKEIMKIIQLKYHSFDNSVRMILYEHNPFHMFNK